MPGSPTDLQLATRIHSRVAPDGSEDMITVADILDMIPDAVSDLADAILASKQFYRLHATTQVTVTNGTGAIPVAVMAESIKDTEGGVVFFTRSDISNQPRQPLTWVDWYNELTRLKPTQDYVCYFTVRGTGGGGMLDIYDGYGVACSGTASVVAAVYPADYAALPAGLVNDLAGLVTQRAMARLTQKMAMTPNSPISGNADKEA